VQFLLGHTEIESTVRYLGIEVDDALAIAEQSTSDFGGRADALCAALTDGFGSTTKVTGPA
jgi:hypothetical protein